MAINNTNTNTTDGDKSKTSVQDRLNFTKIFEKRRVVTIAYKLFPERKTMNVQFAGSIFRQVRDDEVYIRKKHVNTARGRIEVRPLYATFPMSEDVRNQLSHAANPTPRTDEEKKKWRESEEYKRWKEARIAFDKDLSKFLRKQIYNFGTGAAVRLRRSETSRAHSNGKIPISG